MYPPIDRSCRQIRLLYFDRSNFDEPYDNRIRLQTRTVELGKYPPFHALSYAWGDEPPTYEILLNGKPFPIRKNLYDALCDQSHLFPMKSMWNNFWIDAICINQEDDRERNHQVDMMSDIFSLADSVIAWLGPESEDSNLALDTLTTRRFAQDRSAILAFFKRPYWLRMWVIQEFIL
ncbi:hypothetical protein M426DRAFT_63793, partial [Hypoxylon sp. CI-4A]